MGQITTDLLSTMKIDWDYLSTDQHEARKQLGIANDYIENNKSYFFVVRKNTFDPVKLIKHQPVDKLTATTSRSENNDTFPKRIEALEVLGKQSDPDTILLATTGKTGRELFEVADKNSHLYMVGSMGCISSLAFGVALSQPTRRVVAIDGDGSLLMRMGAMSTIAYYRPGNFLHVLLDNNSHDSTGGQATVSDHIDFVSLAASIGYTKVINTTSIEEFRKQIKEWEDSPELTFLYMRVAKGSKMNLGRPTITPHQIKDRLKSFING